MKSQPLVTIIITTYYRDESLCESIESAINQDYNPLEVIVVDDSGEGYAKHIVDDYNVTYLEKANNEGQISAWNTGICHSNGSFIQFLDDDDTLLPAKISKQVSLLQSSDHIGVVFCGMKWENGPKSKPPKNLRGKVLKQVLTLDTSPCVTSTMLIRSNVIEKIFPIPEYPASTDDVLKIELAQHTEFNYIDEVLIIRGVGEDNVSSNKKIDSWNKILNDYEELYNRYPEETRSKAVSHIQYEYTKSYLQKHNLSVKEQLLLILTVYRTSEFEIRTTFDLFRIAVGQYIEKPRKTFKRIIEYLHIS